MSTQERNGETERRRATILFADLTGFTALSERLDPEAAYSIVTSRLKLFDAIARRYGGSVDKYLGDCIMAVFGVPSAIENAPKAALNAAIEMHNCVRQLNREEGGQTPLGVHTGINSGLVISGDISGPVIREFAVMGDAVNIAARLKDLAPPDCIWVGPETYRYTRDEFEFRALDPIPLKGKQQLVQAYEVLSKSERLYRPAVESRAKIGSELVGRRHELSRLRACLSALLSGAGGVATIVGDAGIGKSRLVAELAASEEADSVTWLEGRSLCVGTNLSFHPFSDLLRRWAGIPDDAPEEDALARLRTEIAGLFGDEADDVLPFLVTLTGLRPSEDQRKRLEAIEGEAMEKLILAATSRFLRCLAAQGPVVLASEDLHWCDGSSLDLLIALLRLAKGHPILFLIVMRPDSPDILKRVLEASSAVGPARLEDARLKPLDRGSAEELLDNLFRGGDLPHATRSLIEERTGGNPFFIEEVVRSLIEEGAVEFREGALWTTDKIDAVQIPGSVREVIMARIDRLPIPIKRALQAAAIIGRTAYTRILAHILDRDDLEESLEALIDGQLLVRRERLGESVYEFTHPLIQEVAYEAVSLERRQEYHRRVACAVEELFSENHPGYFGMLAYHFSLGRDLERAEEYLFLAGDQASRAAASSEALPLLQQAARLYFEMHGEGGDPKKKALLEKKIAMAFFARGRMLEGDEHFDRALALLGQSVPRTKISRQLRFAMSLAAVLGDLYLSRISRRRRTPTDQDREIIAMTFARAQAETTADPGHFLLDSMETVRRLNRVDPRSVERAGGQYAGAVALFVYSGLSYGIGKRFLARAESLVDRDDAREALLYDLMNFLYHLFLGDWDDRHTVDRELIEENLRLGELWNVINYLPLDARRKVHQGRFEEAAEDLERITKMGDLYAYDLAKSNGLAITMFLQLERRQLPEALRTAEAYFEDFEEDLLNLLALSTRAKIEILLGDLESAEASLDRAGRIVARSSFLPPFHRSPYLTTRFWLDLACFERALDRSDRALRRLFRRRAIRAGKQAVAKARKISWQRPEAYRLAGRFAWLDGRERSALRCWTRSVEEAETLGMRPELGRIYLEIGRCLSRSRGGRDFRGLSAEGCFEKATRLFEELDLAWDSEQLAAVRKGSGTSSALHF